MIAMILAVRKSNEVLQDNANVVLQALRFSFDIRLRCLEVENWTLFSTCWSFGI
jgi:hypothetical protein